MTTERTLTNQQINSIVVDESSAHPTFVYYALRNRVDEIRAIAGGSATPIVNKSTFENLQITVVSLPVQQAIGRLLDALDNKIESNRRVGEIAHDLLRSLFRAWFVEFVPWDGVVPSDWREGLLGDLLDSVKSPTKAGALPHLPYVPIDSIPMQSLGLQDFRSNDEAQSSLIRFQKNDILVGAMRVYFHRVAIAPFDGITRTTTFVLRPKDDRYLEYCLLLCDQNSTIDFAEGSSRGSTMPYAVWSNGLADMPILIPSIEQVQRFSALTRPVVKLVRDRLFETRRLVELRETLLPELLTGRIRVPLNRDAAEVTE